MMNEAVEIAASKKIAALNIWLSGTSADCPIADKKLMLLGVAAGLAADPEIDAALSQRAKSFMPSLEEARAFVVAGAETWGAYYEAYRSIQAILTQFDAGEITDAEAIGYIEAVAVPAV